jgi:hypothetical protein
MAPHAEAEKRTFAAERATSPGTGRREHATGTEDRRADGCCAPPRIHEPDPGLPAYDWTPPVQSGTLTAGSFDDHQNIDAYRRFLNDTRQNDPEQRLPQVPLDRRVVVRVTNGQGEPVADARVLITNRGMQQREIELTTGSDGRAIFLPLGQGGHAARECRVTVHSPTGTASTTHGMRLDQHTWNIVVPRAKSRRPERLDLALVVDTTGSMGDELDYLKAEIDDIAETIHRMFPHVDQRYALITYRDQGDQYVTRSYDFTGSLSDFRATLANQRAAGGGDYPEAMDNALQNAADLSWNKSATARVLFLVADAPPHDRSLQRTMQSVQSLQQRGVRIFPVGASGVRWKAEFVMRAASFLTMGKYLFLTDHSGVGNAHAAPHVPEYAVEHLNRLMVRMIAEQLAGKSLVPHEVLAIERGDLSALAYTPAVMEQQQSTPVCIVKSSPPSIGSLAAYVPWRLVLLAIVVCCVFGLDFLRDRSRVV